MTGELAPLQDVLSRVGVAHDSEDAVEVLALLRAVSAEVRAQTKRQFATADAIHNDIVDADRQPDLILPNVPVSEVLSVNRVYSDGTEDAIDEPNRRVHDGVLSWSTVTAGALAIGDTTVELSDVTDVAVGDHMQIAADEVVRITAIDGTDVTFEPAARFVNVSGIAVKHVEGSTYWRLVDGDRGRVKFPFRRSLLRIIYRVTASAPADITTAVVDWCDARWQTRGQPGGLTSYSTGDDSESYDANMAGSAPASSARVLARYWRSTRNGVV